MRTDPQQFILILLVIYLLGVATPVLFLRLVVTEREDSCLLNTILGMIGVIGLICGIVILR